MLNQRQPRRKRAALLKRAGQQLTTLDSPHSRAASALIAAEGPV
ncbi:hypothetical protein [Streptomyces rapamycinicus]|uniref:Uncharacterized protein n=1 Tax=Streptomyces rapamycinicus TaxID=1226757 RepID=A0ABR6M1T5_9ACTN|nr:hypothetical protein [Streptomyces rapamycinicus]AGP60304.1 hypothetical protein M271_44680 [Streptomyces rapamycinicus NRRL 5491]MBB4788532.1 hypothetical protein [Streptomyces rapamycinicus]